MGLHFGELAKNIRGVVMYKLSPHEQKPFAGAITHGIPNMVRRIRENVFKVAPPFVVAYVVYQWAEMTHHQSLKKNPHDFMFEVDPEARQEE